MSEAAVRWQQRKKKIAGAFKKENEKKVIRIPISERESNPLYSDESL